MTRVKASGLTKEIRAVLTSDWQSVAAIACQLVIAPDALSRLTMRAPDGRVRTLKSAATYLVSRRVIAMSDVERRLGPNGKYEYRLKAKPNDTSPTNNRNRSRNESSHRSPVVQGGRSNSLGHQSQRDYRFVTHAGTVRDERRNQ